MSGYHLGHLGSKGLFTRGIHQLELDYKTYGL
jgi:hypothetical protein